MINWSIEWPQIEQVSAPDYGVDPVFMAAIRHTENGGPGREFGVLSEETVGYIGQLRAACATVRDRLLAYPLNPFVVMQSGKTRRLVYTRSFIEAFAEHWAPTGAANDPDNLNANWLSNATTFYFASLSLGRVQ